MDRERRSRSGFSRRRALLAAGGLLGAGAAAFVPSTSFTGGTVPRSSGLGVVSDSNGVVGLVVSSPVETGTRDPVVDVTNNYDDPLSVTVSLNTCSDGTLYDPSNDNGCSVTFPLAVGATKTVDVDAAVANTTVPFTVTATTTGFRFEATRSTTAQNKVRGPVSVKKFQVGKPAVDPGRDQFTVKQLRLRDNDGDADLTRRTLTVTDANGNAVALTNTPSTAAPDRTFGPTGSWSEKKVTFQADENLVAGRTYYLELTGYDADGNTDSATRTVTA